MSSALPVREETDVKSNSEPSGQEKPRVESQRPLTRSQTGTVTKRRVRDDDDSLFEQKPSTSRKKTRASRSKSSMGQVDDGSATTNDPSASHIIAALPAPHRHLTFMNSPETHGDDYADSLGPRSRATLPVPVPNLTKKSRGRRVPTKNERATDSDSNKDAESRSYVCKVDGCGKAFHRGEHLKRHIRSIHTHEKPFKCMVPTCNKFFNRHDNLLQHLKVHKDGKDLMATPTENAESASLGRKSLDREEQRSPKGDYATFPISSFQTNQSLARYLQNGSQTSQFPPPPFATSAHSSYTSNSFLHTVPFSSSSFQASTSPFPSSTGVFPRPGRSSNYTYEASPRKANMAVSSLRTEIPNGPDASPRVPADSLDGAALGSSREVDGGPEQNNILNESTSPVDSTLGDGSVTPMALYKAYGGRAQSSNRTEYDDLPRSYVYKRSGSRTTDNPVRIGARGALEQHIQSLGRHHAGEWATSA